MHQSTLEARAQEQGHGPTGHQARQWRGWGRTPRLVSSSGAQHRVSSPSTRAPTLRPPPSSSSSATPPASLGHEERGAEPQPGQQRSRRAATGRRLGCPLGGTPAGSLLARCFCALHGGACLSHVLHRACRADRRSLTPAPAWLPPRKVRPWAALPPGRWNVPDTAHGNTRP